MFCLRPSGSIYVLIPLDSSVAFRLLAFRKNVLRFRYRSLKFDASPTYDSVVVTVVTVVSVSFGMQTSFAWRHLPSSGHSAFFLQLQPGS